MLHHVSLPVANLALSATFYDAVLAALGYRRVFEDETAVGYGIEDGDDKLCLKQRDSAGAISSGFHLAFAAPDRAAVDNFHHAGLASGGQDNGAPGTREDYGPRHYAAFLFDPDGHHIEAVINT